MTLEEHHIFKWIYLQIKQDNVIEFLNFFVILQNYLEKHLQ